MTFRLSKGGGSGGYPQKLMNLKKKKVKRNEGLSFKVRFF